MDAFTVRDELLVSDVQKMAELGKFATEFVFYGCAFYEENEIWAVVSENKEKIYEFIYDVNNAAKLPTQVRTWRYITKVPGGMREKIAAEQEMVLAKEIFARYPAEFFSTVADFFEKLYRKDDAYAVLSAQMYQLDGVCDAERLQLFRGLLELAYSKRLVLEKHYLDFQQWIFWQERDLANMPVKKDKYLQTFYAFAYLENREIKICIDGSKGNIYSKLESKQQEKAILSPLVSKKWWYNNSYSVKDAREDCLQYFKELFSEEYMNTLQKIISMKYNIDVKVLDEMRKVIFEMENEDLNKEWEKLQQIFIS